MPTTVTTTDAIEWDVVTWSSALTYWEQAVRLGPGLRCLDVGARRGGLSLWLASKGNHVLCTDLSHPEVQALSYHARFAFSGTIEYEALDVLDIPYSSEFDVIAFKSVLGGVGRDGHPERQQRAVEQIHKALKPGGALLFAENLSGSVIHRLLRRGFVHWGRSWRYVSIPELRAFLGVFSRLELHTAGFCSAFGRTERQRQILALFDRAMQPIIPASARYVAFGVAWK